MHAIHITSTVPQIGGVTTHINTVTEALGRLSVTPLVINPLGIGERTPIMSPWAGAQVQRCVTGWMLPPSLALSRFILRRRLAAVGLQRATTVIHAHDVVAALAGPTHLPLVLTVHGDLANQLAGESKVRAGSFPWRALLALETAAYHRADAVITVDTRLSKHVAAMAPVARISIVPNGVNPAEFRPDPLRRQKLRREADIADNTLLVLVPRRLLNKYGPAVALEAIGRLTSAEKERVRLIYAGDGPLADSLRKAAAGAGVEGMVWFLGMVPPRSMANWYQMADLVLIPSLGHTDSVEASSIATLEAMASEVLVAASAVGGLRELITDGESGLLLPPGEPEAIATVIRRCLTSPGDYRRVAAAGRQRVLERFSTAEVARRYKEIYAEVMQERGGYVP